jgi:protocatechuate 3,4-dioxygenase beta subunit
MTAAVAIAVLLCLQRDVPAARPAATASIAGTVMSDHAQPKPLRRARVTLNGGGSPGRTAITADDGTFVFDGLRPGRYTLGATKDGYVAMSYGAARATRPGIAIAVGSGETRRISVTLPRGAVITGTIADADGVPMHGALVTALGYRYVGLSGERRALPAGISAGPSDDRGIYRIFGLPAGDYVIMAQTRHIGPMQATELRTVSQDAVSRRTVSLVPSYHPATADVGRATTVTVNAGEERGGIDVQMQYVTTARVSGVAPVIADVHTYVSLIRTGDAFGVDGSRGSHANDDGRFSFAGIAPGQYSVTARSNPPGRHLWGKVDIVVDGEDISNVAITMQPTLTISGRVVFEGTRTPPPLAGLQVRDFALTNLGNTSRMLPDVKLEPDNRFSIADITPGEYRMLHADLPGLRVPTGGWWLKSIVVHGRELLDARVDLRQSADDAVVTFSDAASEISGRVTDMQRVPMAAQTVLVFTTDTSKWFFNSRRIAPLRTDAEGRYVVRNLPPGEYRVAITTELEQGEWFDPDVLAHLPGTTFTVTGVEKQTHDVVVK